jgi:hypothetical protein
VVDSVVDLVVAKYGVFKEELELKKLILAKVDIKLKKNVE